MQQLLLQRMRRDEQCVYFAMRSLRILTGGTARGLVNLAWSSVTSGRERDPQACPKRLNATLSDLNLNTHLNSVELLGNALSSLYNLWTRLLSSSLLFQPLFSFTRISVAQHLDLAALSPSFQPLACLNPSRGSGTVSTAVELSCGE